MSRKSRANPRMLSNVLQAVADLQDAKGSTAKKILLQVQTAINISNLKPKPRNIVTQVKKALRHAVETGILKMTAGKYKLALGQGNSSTSTKKKGKTNHKARSHKKKKIDDGDEEEKSDRRCRKPDRRKKQRLQRRRKPCRKRSHSDSPTTTNTRCSTCYDSSSICTYFDSDDDYIRRRSSGKKRSHKKNVRIRQPKRRRGRKKRRVKRRCTPVPMFPDKSIGGLDDATPSFNSKKCSNISQDEYVPQSLPDFPQDSSIEPLEMHPECDNINPEYDSPNPEYDNPNPECDNPNCLCNLKQEPFNYDHYDDVNDSQFI